MRSRDLRPGDRLQSKDGTVVTLARRKHPDEDHHGLPFHPGWWIEEGGGLADFAIEHPENGWAQYDGDGDGERSES